MADQSLDYGRANRSLNAVALSAGVLGTSFGIPSKCLGEGAEITWQIHYAGVPTTPSLSLQGSLDDVNWFDLDTYTGTTDTMRSLSDKIILYIRAKIVGGSATNVTVDILVR